MSINNYIKRVRVAVESYYKNNDSAHRIDHADDVVDTALYLCDTEGHDVHTCRLVILAGYYHDVRADDRKNHHTKAYDIVMQADTSELNNLSGDDRTLVAKACLQHRASYDGELTSEVSEMISCADRGKPDLKAFIDRAASYSETKLGLCPTVAYIRAVAHICTKYNRKSTTNYPKIFYKYFGDELSVLQDQIDTILHDKKLLEYVNSILMFKELKVRGWHWDENEVLSENVTLMITDLCTAEMLLNTLESTINSYCK